MPDRLRRRLLPACLLLVAAACGPTPPDYAALSRIAVDNGTCGGTWTAEEVVRMAYEKPRFEGVPNPDDLPDGTLQVAGPLIADTAVRRAYPCAKSEADAAVVLEAFGYTDSSLQKKTDEVYLFEARDPYGIPGTYSVFSCAYVSDINAVLSGGEFDLGLYGLFESAAPPDYEALLDFAARSFRTGMVQPATVDYVDRGGPVFLRASDALTVEPFPGQNDPVTTRLDVCYTWIHPNIWGGCDTVVVGAAATLLDPDDPARFHQLAIRGSPVYRFTGYCGRSE